MPRVVYVIVAATIVAIGVATIVGFPRDSTSHLSYDSIRYLAGAESLRSAGVYRSYDGSPITHWPAGTSLVYATASRLLHRTPEASIIIVNSSAYVLFCTSLLLLLRSLGVSAVPTLLVAAAVLLNSALLTMHRLLWSEPIFMPLWMGFIAAAVQAFSKPVDASAASWRPFWMLPLAGLLLGSALAVRYVAIVGLPLLFLAGVQACRSVPRGKTALGVAAVMFALPHALLRTLPAFAGDSAPRNMSAFVTAPAAALRNAVAGLAQMADQIVPLKAGGTVVGASFIFGWLAAPMAIVMLERRRGLLQPGVQIRLVFLFLAITGYVGFILIVQIFVDPATPFDLRILAPILPLLFALGAGATMLGSKRGPLAPLAHAWTLAVLLCLVIASARNLRGVAGRIIQPRPIASQTIPVRDQVIKQIRDAATSLHPSDTLVSNAPAITWYALRRRVIPFERLSERCTAGREQRCVAILVDMPRQDDSSWDDHRPALIGVQRTDAEQRGARIIVIKVADKP